MSDKIRYSGESMTPFLREGDTLVYEQLQRFSVGDIILFYDGTSKEVTAHRCVKKDWDQNIWVKGDRNLSFDHFIQSHYIGRVHTIVRGAKNIDLDAKRMKQQWIAFFSFYSEQRYGKVMRYFSQFMIKIFCF